MFAFAKTTLCESVAQPSVARSVGEGTMSPFVPATPAKEGDHRSNRPLILLPRLQRVMRRQQIMAVNYRHICWFSQFDSAPPLLYSGPAVLVSASLGLLVVNLDTLGIVLEPVLLCLK